MSRFWKNLSAILRRFCGFIRPNLVNPSIYMCYLIIYLAIRNGGDLLALVLGYFQVRLPSTRINLWKRWNWAIRTSQKTNSSKYCFDTRLGLLLNGYFSLIHHRFWCYISRNALAVSRWVIIRRTNAAPMQKTLWYGSQMNLCPADKWKFLRKGICCIICRSRDHGFMWDRRRYRWLG